MKVIERSLMKAKQKTSILNLYEAFYKLKMNKINCEWSERITRNESNFIKTHEYIDDSESLDSPTNLASNYIHQKITKRKGSMKSITYFQRQDFYIKDHIEGRKNFKRYKPINTCHQNWSINQHLNIYHKFENSIVERLEKSIKSESIFKDENVPKRNIYHKKSFNERVSKFIKSAQKSRKASNFTNNYEIIPKEENYLLNEIIEHILSTQNNSKIQWNKIRASPFKTTRNYSRDYRSSFSTRYTLERKPDSFKRCQSTSNALAPSEGCADPIEIMPNNFMTTNMFEFNKDSCSKTINSVNESSSLNQSKDKRSSKIETKIQLSANRLSSKKKSSGVREYETSEEKLNLDNEYNSQSSKESSSLNDHKRQLIFTQNESILNESASYSSRKNIENNSNNISIEKDVCSFKDLFVPQHSNKNSQIVKLIEQEKLKRGNNNGNMKAKQVKNYNLQNKKENINKHIRAQKIITNKIDLIDQEEEIVNANSNPNSLSNQLRKRIEMNNQGMKTHRLKESFPKIFDLNKDSKRSHPHYKSRNSENSPLGESKNNPEMELTDNIHSQKTTNTLTGIKDKNHYDEIHEDNINISLNENKFPVWNADTSNFNNYQIFSTFNCNNHELHQTDGAKVNNIDLDIEIGFNCQYELIKI